jgi:hypothetical protein
MEPIARDHDDVAPGDLVVVASDGLHPETSGLDWERFAAMLREPGALETRVARIMAAGGRAAEGGGGDNLTLVAIEVPAA